MNIDAQPEVLQGPSRFQHGLEAAERFGRSNIARIAMAVFAIGGTEAILASPAEAAPSDEVRFNPYCYQHMEGNWEVKVGIRAPNPPQPDTVDITVGSNSRTMDVQPGEGTFATSIFTGQQSFSGEGSITYRNTGYANKNVQITITCPSDTYPNTYEGPPPTHATVTTKPYIPPPTTATTSGDIGRGVNPPRTTSPTAANTTVNVAPSTTTEALATNTTIQTTEIPTTLKEVAKGPDADDTSDGKLAPVLPIIGISAIVFGTVLLRRRARRAA